MGVAVGLLVDVCDCNKAASVSTVNGNCRDVFHVQQT